MLRIVYYTIILITIITVIIIMPIFRGGTACQGAESHGSPLNKSLPTGVAMQDNQLLI